MTFRSITFAALALMTCLGVHALLDASPGLTRAALTTPSAHAASFLSGSPLVKGPDGEYMLFVSVGKPQKVTSACSGSGFFSILAGLMVWQALSRGAPRRPLIHLCAAVVLYPFAIAINGCRIALSGIAAATGDTLLGANYHAIIHMGLGSLVFLFAIIIFNQSIEYACRNPCKAV